MTGRPTVMVVHPSADVYGSDRQVLETVRGLVAEGWSVRAVLPLRGPLHDALLDLDIPVLVDPRMPVLRRSSVTGGSAGPFLVQLLRGVVAGYRLLRRHRPDVLLVNTVVLPSWVFSARLAGVAVVVHVHEDENRAPAPVRKLLLAPLTLAAAVVANSLSTRESIGRTWPRVVPRTVTVENGVQGPREAPSAVDRRAGEPLRLVQVGRLSSVKGTDVALEALALARGRGVDAHLVLCGDVFPGNEAFLDTLQRRADEADLRGHVTFAGKVPEPWPWLARAHAVVVPSRMESFGNAAVESMLARRPVVVSAVQGLATLVRDGVSGLTVPAGDPVALAGAIESLADDPHGAGARADVAFAEAQARFDPAAYRERIVDVINGVARQRAG